MTTKILFSSVAFGAFALLASVLPLAHAASVFDITYPIPELGNCSDRLACKTYCDEPANQQACEAFARHYGLTVTSQHQPENSQGEQGRTSDQNSSQINQDLALQAIQQDGGPGQCGAGTSESVRACGEYCNAASHIQECVAYGKSHGLFSGDQLSQAEKVAAALQSGVSLPSGCTDAQSCQQSCQNPQTLDQAKSCFAFAKAAGILPSNFDEAKAEKVFESIQNGTAPFSSMKDFQQCQNTSDPAILKKCTDFAVQAGFMTQQQADTLQQTGGKGPGDCTGQDECQQYCANHQNECFQFAQQHNLITPEQQDQMKQAAQQMQQSINNAPDSVRQCIIAAVGQSTLDAITSGTQPGTPQIGQTMQQCFEQFRQQGNASGNENDQFGPPQSGQNGPGRPQSPGSGDFQNYGASTTSYEKIGTSTMPGPQGMMPPPNDGSREYYMSSSSQQGRFYGPPPPNQNLQGQQYYGPPNGSNSFNQSYQQGQPPQNMGPNNFQNYGSSTPLGGPQNMYMPPPGDLGPQGSSSQMNYTPPQSPQGSSMPQGIFPPPPGTPNPGQPPQQPTFSPTPPTAAPAPQPTSMNGFLSQVAAVVLSLLPH